jgi:hypothetical protein
MITEDLIARLCRQLRPVRRLPRCGVLVAAWVAVCLVVVGAAVWHYGLRPDLAARMAAGFHLPQILAALLTGGAAGYAAFRLVRPEADRRWVLLPLPALGLWLIIMAGFCIDELSRIGVRALAIEASYPCLVFVLGVGAPLSMAMMWMARHAAPLCPGPVSTLAGLSAAAFASVGLSLVNALDAAAMVLVWHGMAIAAMTLLARLCGPGCMRLMA